MPPVTGDPKDEYRVARYRDWEALLVSGDSNLLELDAADVVPSSELVDRLRTIRASAEAPARAALRNGCRIGIAPPTLNSTGLTDERTIAFLLTAAEEGVGHLSGPHRSTRADLPCRRIWKSNEGGMQRGRVAALIVLLGLLVGVMVVGAPEPGTERSRGFYADCDLSEDRCQVHHIGPARIAATSPPSSRKYVRPTPRKIAAT